MIVAHGFLELLVNSLIDKHCKNGAKINTDGRSYPHSVKLVLLNEMGVLNKSTYKTLNWFRKLRNRAVSKADFKISKSDLAWLPKRYREPNHFHGFCMELVTDFWNQHVETFHPVFGKNLIPVKPAASAGTLDH